MTEDRYESICEASPDAILLVDGDGRITYANGRVSEMFGYDPGALVGEPVEVVVPESEQEAHVAQREAYLDDPETRPMGVELDLSARRKDGTTVPVDISLSPIERGDRTEVMAAVRDVSEQEYHRKKYQTILEAVPDAVVVADARTGKIVEANNQVADLFGYDPAELRGKNQTVLHPSSEKDRDRDFERRAASGESISNNHPDGSDVYIETKEGDRLPVEINAHVFKLSERRLIVSVFRDITGRKEYERQLETLHGASRQLMHADDSETVAQLFAEAADEILGFTSTVVRLVDEGRLRPVAVTEQARAEMGPRPDYPLANENPVSQVYESGEVLYNDDVGNIEDEYERGEARSAIYLPLGEHGVLSIADTASDAFDQSDIELASILAANAETALDRLADERELERQNERLDEFAGIVSHDLRNPLGIAQGWLDEAQAAEPNEELTRVRKALDRMNDIIDDTLTLARRGQTQGEREAIDMADVAGGCWELVSTGEARLEFADEFGIRGDRDRLQHVLENLFRNAVAHGGEDVAVTIGRLDEEGFYVEDDGPGIPEEERESVFEPGHTTAAEGTGLGLTIVKQIADAHGWSVRVTDGSTGGARFEFTGVDFV